MRTRERITSKTTISNKMKKYVLLILTFILILSSAQTIAANISPTAQNSIFNYVLQNNISAYATHNNTPSYSIQFNSSSIELSAIQTDPFAFMFNADELILDRLDMMIDELITISRFNTAFHSDIGLGTNSFDLFGTTPNHADDSLGHGINRPSNNIGSNNNFDSNSNTGFEMLDRLQYISGNNFSRFNQGASPHFNEGIFAEQAPSIERIQLQTQFINDFQSLPIDNRSLEIFAELPDIYLERAISYHNEYYFDRFIVMHRPFEQLNASTTRSASTDSFINTFTQSFTQISSYNISMNDISDNNISHINNQQNPNTGQLELIILSERVNPGALADELRASGADRYIEFIQPDFRLSLAEFVEESTSDVDEPVSDSPSCELYLESTPELYLEATPILEDLMQELQTLDRTPIHRTTYTLVAIIDTGIDSSHFMLSNRMVDGWNFAAQNNTTFNPSHPLASAHGTHIAGIIANAAQEAGAVIRIMPLQVFDNGAAYTSDVIAAINFATENGASIINMSFGSSSANPALYTIMSTTNALFVTAAGNNRHDLDISPTYPAAYRLPNVISVASVNADGGLSFFSNYSTTLVDIAAPGRDIVSTLPNNETGLLSGTSMAAAYVTSIAAVLLAQEQAAQTIQIPQRPIQPQLPQLPGLPQEPEFSLVPELTSTPGYLHTSIPQYTLQTSVVITPAELRERILSSADMLANLQDTVNFGRRANTADALAGINGTFMSVDTANDFNVHGWQPMQDMQSIQGWQANQDVQQAHNMQPNHDEMLELFSADSTTNDVVQVAAGGGHTLILKSDGTVWGWGDNSSGQLAQGFTSEFEEFVQITGLHNITYISAGTYHNFALRADGTVWAWGRNWNGQLGDGTTAPRTTPVQVIGLANITVISAGGNNSLALREDGTVWAWGNNSFGQLGDGTTTQRTTPVQVHGLTNIIAISAGSFHGLALRADGTVWAWGTNTNGRLGDSTTLQRLTPIQVSGLTNVADIVAGNHHSLALRTDGTVWAWGNNTNGQLGDNTTTTRLIPIQAIGLTNITDISVGGFHSIALRADGTVWAWGANWNGQLGVYSIMTSYAPIQTNGISDIIDISANGNHNFALRADGTIWAWGDNYHGQLDGERFYHDTPIHASNLSNVIEIASGGINHLALKADGTVWFWGWDIGWCCNHTHKYITPTQVDGLENVIAVSAGHGFNLALKYDGTVWAWGINYFGQLGNWDECSHIPVQVEGLCDVVSISAGHEHSLALRSDGNVWAWGANWYGQLGDGTYNTSHSPVQVLEVWDVVSITAGRAYSFAIGGSTRAWGNNTEGRLLYNDFSAQNIPIDMGYLTGPMHIFAGGYHTLALCIGESIWSWGANWLGQLGDGTTTQRNFPWYVTGVPDVINISAGFDHNLVLSSDGTVWAWGGNWGGSLGDGSTIQQNSPMKIDLLSDIVSITAGYHTSFAIDSYGRVFVFGSNHGGELGFGRIPQTTTPILIQVFENKYNYNQYLTVARELIEAATFTTVDQADVNTLLTATAHVGYIINNLPLNGVTATVIDNTFTPAVAGTQSNPYGTNGSFTFTVNLTKGTGTQQTTAMLTLVITAAAYVPPKTTYQYIINTDIGTLYVLNLAAENQENFAGMIFELTYNPAELQRLNFIGNSNVTEISSTDGRTTFVINATIPQGMSWSGILAMVEFRVLSSGNAVVEFNIVS